MFALKGSSTDGKGGCRFLIRIFFCCVNCLCVAFWALCACARGEKIIWQSNKKVKIFIVNSYDKTNVCSSPQQEGVIDAISEGGYSVGKNLMLKVFYMDTKRRFVTSKEIK